MFNRKLNREIFNALAAHNPYIAQHFTKSKWQLIHNSFRTHKTYVSQFGQTIVLATKDETGSWNIRSISL